VRPAGVDRDALGRPQVRPVQPARRRAHAHGDDDDVRRHMAAVGEVDPERWTGGPDAVDRRAGDEPHSACPVHCADALRDALAEQRRERERRVYDGRLQPARHHHAGDFGADEPATDDGDALCRAEDGLEALRVVELAQRHDSVGHQRRRSRRFAADGEHEPVVGHTGAVRQ
jgi:hypothetical protein